MRKLITIILTAFLAVASMAVLAACGGNTNETNETFSIDASFTFADAELGETYRPDLSGAKVVGSNGSTSDLTVRIKDNSYTRPDGTTAVMIGGTFVANQLGNYTVTLTASDDSVADVEKTITVKDTTAPVLAPMNAANVPTVALIGSTVTVPTFQATDAGNLAGSPVVKVFDPEEKEVTVENSIFKPTMAGNYTIVATQSDESGNEGSYKTTVNVYNATFDPQTVGYFSSDYGMAQGNAWSGHEAYIAESFVADVTAQGEDSIPAVPDGTKSATKITGATGGRFTYYLNTEQTDFSDYDYLGMWIYNDSDIDCVFEIATTGGTGVNVNHFRFPANSWSYFAINLTIDGVRLPSMNGLQDIDDVTQLGFYVTQVGKTIQEWTQGDSLYFTDLKLGNFDDDKLASFDQPYGIANVTQFGAEVGVANVTYSTEVAQDGADGSLKVTFEVDSCTYYNLKMFSFNGITAENIGESYYLWVYNPNDYSIRFYGYDDAGSVTDIPAQSGAYVKITIKDGGHAMGGHAAWGTCVMPTAGNGATFGVGDCFYVGALYREEPADLPDDPVVTDPTLVGSFSTAEGMEQGNAWPGGHEAFITESFVADVTAQGEDSIPAVPDGTKSATKITGATGNRFTYYLNTQQTDFTGYDYLGMWIYNDSDIDCVFEISSTGGAGANVNHFRFPANAWSYFAINLTSDGIQLPSLSGLQTIDNVTQFSFYVTQVGKSIQEWTQGDSLYFTDLKLGNFDDDKLASFDQPYGIANVTQFGAEVGVANVTYSTEVAQDGADGSLKVTFEVDSCTYYNLKMFSFNGITAENIGESYYLWVYNPNDYSIRFYGYDDAGSVTDIPAQSGAYVKITIKDGGHAMGGHAAWGTCVMPTAGDGATFGVGDCFYVGALYREEPADLAE